MRDATLLGGRIRSLRRHEHLSQAELATKLGISASYLNLIEHDRRPLTAPLLIRLAQLFKLELEAFVGAQDSALVGDLEEMFGDTVVAGHEVTLADLREFAQTSPTAARAVLALYRAYQRARDAAASLAELPGPDHLPSEEVSDVIQRHRNHFPELEHAAERLRAEACPEPDSVEKGLTRFLEERHGLRVRIVPVAEAPGALRRYDPKARTLLLSEALPPRSRNFQLAHQSAFLGEAELLDRLTSREPLTSPDSHALCRVALANYFAGAVLMPYAPFLEAARARRYDIELLGHQFRTSFEQVCHRLTTLQRPGAEGVPFHMIRIDIAGNISKRFSASGIRFARFSGACPRWNVHVAFLTPGMVRTQLSRMPDGTTYFCIARTVSKGGGGYHAPHTVQSIGLGCDVRHGRELVYADGIDLENLDAAVPIGVSCRLCERMDCEQRAFPSLQHPLQIDENVRGVSFYAPPISGRESREPRAGRGAPRRGP